MKSYLAVALFAVLLLACPATLLAQSGNATLSGVVRDASGAIMPSAKVTVTNTATGVARTTMTTATGLYLVPNLIPGNYTIDVISEGFQRKTFADIPLVIDQRATVDVTLELGSVTQQVLVTGAPPVLQTEETSVGTVIPREQVVNLPLNGRSFTQLLQVVPGTLPATRSMFTNADPALAGRQRNLMPAFDVNGASGAWTNFRIDGIENTEREFGGANIPVSIDAIQEVKLQTSSFSAEYGRSPGQVDVVTKAGTNQFHGTLFEFLRNDALDASQWTPTGLHPKLLLKRNQFGGNIGGPVQKDRFFFFFNYEGTREVTSSPRVLTVPSDEVRRGVFPSGVIVFDPYSGQPFPNNTIPAARFDSVTRKVVERVLPAPNLPGSARRNNAGFDLTPINNYFYDPQRRNIINQYLARIDYNRSASDTFNFRYVYGSNFRIGDGPLATNLQGSIVGFETADLGGQNLSFTWYHNFGPTTINEFRFGVSTDPQKYFKGEEKDWAADLGLSQFLSPRAFPGLPRFQIGGVNLGSGDYRPLQTSEANYQVIDNLTLVRGNHHLRVGEDVRRTVLSHKSNWVSNGRFFFNGAQSRDRRFPTQGTTFCPGGTASNGCTAGESTADFLLGYLSFFQRGDAVAPSRRYFTLWSGYIQDTWRIRRNLTLNLGLRYEYTTRTHADPPFFSLPVLRNGEFTGKFAVAQKDGKLSPGILPELAAAIPNSIVGCTEVGLPENCLVPHKRDFQPRLGVAWQISQKTVLRAAGGIFYGIYWGNVDTEDGINFPLLLSSQTQTFTRPPAGNEPPPLLMSNPTAGSQLGTPGSFSSEPSRTLPSHYQWNVTLEREVLRNTSLSVAYVASLNRHLEGSTRCCSYNIPQPWGVVLAPGQTQRVADPRFSTMLVVNNLDSSHYESLQTKLERRLGAATFTGSYTWSKNLGVSAWLSDPRFPQLDKAPLNNDVLHNFVFSSVWQLPFGKGQRWLKVSGVAGHLVGGWQLSTIVTQHSGFPFTPLLSGVDLLSLNGYNGQNRPDRICDGAISNPTPSRWFDKSCFVLPTEPTTPGALLRQGNSGANILRGPGQFGMDAGVAKVFALTEAVRLEFRAEAFNLFNHPTLGLPNATIAPAGNSAPAQITSPTSLPRILQFALKLRF